MSFAGKNATPPEKMSFAGKNATPLEKMSVAGKNATPLEKMSVAGKNATPPEKMDVGAFTDPKRFGPGAWMVLHMFAARADTEERKRNFEYFVRGLAQDFKCLHCREHFLAFIDRHPLSAYYNMKDGEGNDVGMFAWTHALHNNANRFLDKPQCSMEEAFSYYTGRDTGVCTHCGVAESGISGATISGAGISGATISGAGISGAKILGEKKVKFPPVPPHFVTLPSFPSAYSTAGGVSAAGVSTAGVSAATLRPLAGGSMPWSSPHPREEDLIQVVRGEKKREREKERGARFSSR